MVIVPVPLSVAPEMPSQESKCAESTTYSSGFSVPLIIGDGVEDRLLAQELGVEVEPEHRVLAVLGQAVDQPVVLAGEGDGGRPGVVGLEDLDGAPGVLGPGGDDPGHAALLQPEAQLAGADRQAVAGAPHVPATPLAAQRGPAGCPSAPAMSGVAFSAQSSRGRQVGWGADDQHQLAFRPAAASGTNSVLSAKRGRMIVAAVRSLPSVPGL